MDFQKPVEGSGALSLDTFPKLWGWTTSPFCIIYQILPGVIACRDALRMRRKRRSSECRKALAQKRKCDHGNLKARVDLIWT